MEAGREAGSGFERTAAIYARWWIGQLSDATGPVLKDYEVWIRGRITEEQLLQTLKGVKTAIGILKLERVEISGYAGPKARLLVELLEGKNRHIRRIFGVLKDPQFNSPLKVLDLKRIQIGTVKLDIPSSRWRFLTHKEEKTLIRGIRQ